jgi:hypothetical protein
MDNFISKYSDFYDEIFSQDTVPNKENEVDIEKQQPVSIPEPSDYRVSTMTMITEFTCSINLSVVDRYFKMDDKIISMVYGDKPVKSSNMKKKKNRPFFNQATLVVRLDPLRKINIKIFSNGRIQMTGVKKKEEGLEALNLILDKLRKTSGKVPLTKILLSQQIPLLMEKLNTDTLPDYYFRYLPKPPKKSAWHKYSPNQITEEERLAQIQKDKDIDKVNYGESYELGIDWKALIQNGNRELIESKINIKRVEEELLKLYEGQDTEIMADAIEDKNRIEILPLQTVLINSDFNINFKIKRNILHSILKDKYNIVSRYEPGIYPGVNNKYYWNLNNLHTKTEGRCMCEGKCEGKGNGNGEGDCKKITIAAFQSGSVIITGAKTMRHIEDAYRYINQVITDNFDLIQKVDTPFADLEKGIVKPVSKKYTKTSDIIYINKETLINPHNSEETLRKFKKIWKIESLS